MRHTTAAKIRRYKLGRQKLVRKVTEIATQADSLAFTIDATIRTEARIKKKRVPLERIETEIADRVVPIREIAQREASTANRYDRRIRALVNA